MVEKQPRLADRGEKEVLGTKVILASAGKGFHLSTPSRVY
jgi:hypothetical protein